MQLLEHLVELGFLLEADAGGVGEADAAGFDGGVVGEAAGGMEFAGVGLVAAELEGGGDVEGELVAAVRDAAAGGPALLAEEVLDAEVFDQAVGEDRVDLDGVAVG